MIRILLISFFCSAGVSFAQNDSLRIEKMVKGLSVEDRVGQLFMAAAYSNRSGKHVDSLLDLVKDESIGGVIFFQGDIAGQVRITNTLQKKSDIPLMIGIDAEWGLAMRLSDAPVFPRQMTLAATGDSVLIYKMAVNIAQACNRIGVHINFAPVVDVNSNPLNPVIGMRSFGQDKELVTRMSLAYMRGLQDNGILACAKHFPGHGDTDADSHKTLPTVNASMTRLRELELYPYYALIRAGVETIMAAHLNVPAITGDTTLPSSLSAKVIRDLLRKELGFTGLVFSDALNMKGVSNAYPTGELEIRALQAGNDVLLFSEDIPAAKEAILQAVNDGRLSVEVIDRACFRVLLAKKKLGILEKVKKIEEKRVVSDLNTRDTRLIRRRLIEKSITLVKNHNNILPLQGLDSLRIAAVSFGGEPTAFLTGLQRYAPVKTFQISSYKSNSTLLDSLKSYDLIIVGVHAHMYNRNDNYGVTSGVLRLVRDVNIEHRTIVALFGNPYALDEFFGVKDVDAIVLGYEDNEVSQDYVSQAIFGGISVGGRLPVDASPWFRYGDGFSTQKIRFKYTVPEDVGMNSTHLKKIDSIATAGVLEGAYPGCQILIARNGSVIYEKAFGYHTYDSIQPVRLTDIYDLASVTKIAATTATVMKLTDEGKISIDKTLGDYLPDLVKKTPYQGVVLRQMMAHQAGFFPWIPFFLNTLIDKKPDPLVYHVSPDSVYTNRVAGMMYARPDLRDSILARIVREPVHWRKKYKYSDFGFYLLHKIIEDITGEPMEDYVQKNFYRPLGLSTMTYKPLEKFPLSRITPTEFDTSFRMQLVHGDVHDQGAAMMGGVSGHAGLFSNANDLGKFMQMLIDGGQYGGRRYISDTTLNDFTRCQYCDNDNRRGAGFDKPVRGNTPGPTCGCVSYRSFGHTGFTGITAWGDPVENVVYIFLSNRVYPIADNPIILRLNTRTDIQQVIYDSIKMGY